MSMLTIAQVTAIIVLLQAFNADPLVVEQVRVQLTPVKVAVERSVAPVTFDVLEKPLEPLTIKAVIGLPTKEGITYGGNCSVVEFTTNREVEFNGETGTRFLYKPQGTSTVERLVFGDKLFELEVGDTPMAAGKRVVKDESNPNEARWSIEGTGIRFDPVTGKCL